MEQHPFSRRNPISHNLESSKEEIRYCSSAPLVETISILEAEAMAMRLAAIADPVRLRLLGLLQNSPSAEVCACDFVGPLGKSQSTVSHHLKVLSAAGVIRGRRRGKWIWYSLVDEVISELCSAIGELVAR